MKSLNRADAEYYRLLLEIMGNGKNKSDRTGTGTKSIFDHKVKFDMADGFPLLTTKNIHVRSIIHELLWFLNGDTNTRYLNENGVTIWDEWADENGNLGRVYGAQWVDWAAGNVDEHDFTTKWRNINQIQNAIDTLKNNPDSRRIMVSAWNVGEIEQMALPPCHWAFELYTEELTQDERGQMFRSKSMGPKLGFDIVDEKPVPPKKTKTEHYDEYNVPKYRLHLKWHQRSVDVGLGLPFNIASYALLLHMFAQQTNMVPGTLVGDLTNVHIYDNHLDQIKEQMTRGSKSEQPTIKLNKAKDIFSYKYEDFEIIGYDAHPNIKMPIAV